MNTPLRFFCFVMQVVYLVLIVLTNFSVPGRSHYDDFDMQSIKHEPSDADSKHKDMGIWIRDHAYTDFDKQLAVVKVFIVLSFFLACINLYFFGRNIAPSNSDFFENMDIREKYVYATCKLISLGIQFYILLPAVWVFSTVVKIQPSFWPIIVALLALTVAATLFFTVALSLIDLPPLDAKFQIIGRPHYYFILILVFEVITLLISFGCLAKVGVTKDGSSGASEIQAIKAMTSFPPSSYYEGWVYGLYGTQQVGCLFIVVLVCVMLLTRTPKRIKYLLIFLVVAVIGLYLVSLSFAWMLSRSGIFLADIECKNCLAAFGVALAMFVLQTIALILTISAANNIHYDDDRTYEEFPIISVESLKKKSSASKRDPSIAEPNESTAAENLGENSQRISSILEPKESTATESLKKDSKKVSSIVDPKESAAAESLKKDSKRLSSNVTPIENMAEGSQGGEEKRETFDNAGENEEKKSKGSFK